MSNAPKYRKKAVEYEQLKQFDRAVAGYVRAIEESEKAGEEIDVALFNKVGDLTLRQGRVTEAVTYYERAVEHYASSGLYDNAIALCNKILRNAPGRSNVYFTLGRICGRKGLRNDATRNFLEYATRMQGEGRVDEGMRALAEVADLMPELLEVRKLVEEHAVRAGIQLPERRRATPQASAAQSTNAAGQLFGLSRDLIFLDIDYDRPTTVRGRTPPLVRAVNPTPLAAPVIGAATVAETPAALPAVESVALELPEPVRLDDLLTFEHRESEEPEKTEAGEFADSTVVDAASILRPYVDPETPLPALPDLEPTDLVGTPRYSQAIEEHLALAELLRRGVAPLSAAVAEPLESPAITPLGNAVSIEEETGDDAVDVVHAMHDGDWDSIEVPDIEPVDALQDDDLAVAVAIDSGIDVTVENASDGIEQSADEVETPEDTAVQSRVDRDTDAIAYAVADDAVVDDAVADDVVPIDAVVDDVVAETLSSELFDAELADALRADDDSLFNEADFADEAAIVIDPFDGFTAEEDLHPPVAHITGGMDVIQGPVLAAALDFVVDADEVNAIDFDAMIDAPETVAHIDDLEFEEFEPVNHETVDHTLAAHSVVLHEVPRDDEKCDTRPDAFDSANELPPLIFPMPFDAYPLNKTETPQALFAPGTGDALFAEPGDMPLETAFEETFEASYEPISFEPPAEPSFGEIAFEGTFDEPTLEGTYNAPYGAAYEASLDAAFDMPLDTARDSLASAPSDASFETPVELPFLVSGDAFDSDAFDSDAFDSDAFDSDDDSVAEVAGDLDDLFADGDVPTAIAAAEAAVVAGSRRDELMAAVDASPNDWALRRRLAEALFEAGERDAAIAELVAALAGHENDGALREAAAITDALVHVAGDQVRHHQKRVELAVRLGDQDRVKEAYLDLADNLVRHADDPRACVVYARVLEIDPWDDRARAALGDAAPPPPPRIEPGSDENMVDLASWLRDEDEPQSTRLRMREPEISGNEQDDFNSLLRHFKEGVARSLGEDDHDSHYDLGVAYKEMGLLDDAIGEFQKALRSRNNRLAAYEALGQCFLEQHSYKVAVTVLSRALHEPAIRDEQRVGVLYLLGYSCEALQRFDEARSYFQRVYATDILFRDVAQRLADLDRITR